jgi:hypothetical protein
MISWNLLTVVWNTFGIRLEYIRNTFKICLEYVRNTTGQELEKNGKHPISVSALQCNSSDNLRASKQPCHCPSRCYKHCDRSYAPLESRTGSFKLPKILPPCRQLNRSTNAGHKTTFPQLLWPNGRPFRFGSENVFRFQKARKNNRSLNCCKIVECQYVHELHCMKIMAWY